MPSQGQVEPDRRNAPALDRIGSNEKWEANVTPTSNYTLRRERRSLLPAAHVLAGHSQNE